MTSYLSPAELNSALILPDLSNPAHGHYFMQTMLDNVVDALSNAWKTPADIIRTSPLVAVADNYTILVSAPRPSLETGNTRAT